MSDSIDRVFVHALNTIKKIPRTGSARPPSSDRLRLYGLYKQSMEGDVEGVMARPEVKGGDGERERERERGEREKWDAWSAHHGLSRTAAKCEYINTLIATMHKYAYNTPEARELVAELEFVWDQVKANSNPSSGSSYKDGPTKQRERSLRREVPDTDPPEYQEQQENIDVRGLRLLRPASEDDDENEASNDDEGEEGGGGGANEDAVVAVARLTQYLGPSQNKDQRNNNIPLPPILSADIQSRKWRTRIEHALIKLTAEVAALREQMQAAHVFPNPQGPHRGLGPRMRWLVWVAIRHLAIDAMVVGLVWAWVRWRRKGIGSVEGWAEGWILGFVEWWERMRTRMRGTMQFVKEK